MPSIQHYLGSKLLYYLLEAKRVKMPTLPILAALKKEDLSDTRISINVGSNSDTIQVASGLNVIDNNPNKERFDLLPRQVLTVDDLTQLLRNPFFETSNPNPTNSPTSQQLIHTLRGLLMALKWVLRAV